MTWVAPWAEITVLTADRTSVAVLPSLTRSEPLCDNSKQTILGLFIGKTAVDFDGGTNAWEQGGIKSLLNYINVRRNGLAERTELGPSHIAYIYAYILEKSVPWCATTTELNDGENPTYPGNRQVLF